MAKELLINVSEGEECRIALLADGKLQELYMERTSATSHVGNIYKGKVTNVEPSIQAAFVDFGLGRNGFLHISDLMPTYFGRKGEEVQESVGRKMSRRDRPPIQRCLRRGDEIVVQIIKEGIGTKGPTLSTYLSIPGRILVMMPGMGKMGISRKIEDEQERKRLRQILDGLKPPKDVGFIIRTAGIGKTKTEIDRDLRYLTRLWENIEKTRKASPAPVELYTEGDLVTRTVRDVFSADIDRIIVDNKDVARKVKEFFKIAMPRTKNKVEIYDEPVPLFHQYGIEGEIEQMYSRHVPLPSGGSLVIDSTEAIVAIDVNSGKFRDHADAETTAFKTDMEAAEEIPRQLKLRDLGGVIICDFIDLRYERHRRELERKLNECFKKDRAKTKVLRMSQFGIIEITRQRMRPSLKRSIYFDCPHCKGSGLVKTPESMTLDVMRRLAIAAHDERVARIELSVCADVSFHLQNKKRKRLAELEETTGKAIIIRVDGSLGLDEVRLDLYDQRDGLVYLQELGQSPGDGHAHHHRPRNGRQDQRSQRTTRHQQPTLRQPRAVAELPMEDRELLEHDNDEHEQDDQDQERKAPRQRQDSESRQGSEQRKESERDESSDQAASDEQDPLSREAESDEASDPRDEQENGERRNGRRRGRRGRRGRGGRSAEAQHDDTHDRDHEPHAREEDAGEPTEALDAAAEEEPRPAKTSTRTPSAPSARKRTTRQPAKTEPAPERTAPVTDEPPATDEPEAETTDTAEQESDEQPKRRRRGRRGGRNRRSADTATADATTAHAAADEDADETPDGTDQAAAGASEETPASKAAPRGKQPASEPDTKTETQRPTPTRRAKTASRSTTARKTSAPTPTREIATPPVVRTGSTDRHLMNDEPLATPPARRPRSIRDLDAIPDDYD